MRRARECDCALLLVCQRAASNRLHCILTPLGISAEKDSGSPSLQDCLGPLFSEASRMHPNGLADILHQHAKVAQDYPLGRRSRPILAAESGRFGGACHWRALCSRADGLKPLERPSNVNRMGAELERMELNGWPVAVCSVCQPQV